MKVWLAIPLWQRVLAGLMIGLALGVVFGERATVLKSIGDLFLAAIKMLAIPMIFATLSAGVASLGDPAKLGRLGGKAILIFMGTAVVAVTIGLALAILFKPGVGLEITTVVAPSAAPPPTAVERILGVVPQNPFASFAEGEVLQILVFAILVGIGCVMGGKTTQPLVKVLEAGAEVMIKIAGLVMELAPFGVMGLMAWVAGTYGLEALKPLATLGLILYLGCLLQALVFYSGLLKLIDLKVVPFFRGVSDAISVAYATASSSATLPVTLKCVEHNLGVDKPTASFVSSLGSTVNMDGTSLYLAMATVFGAQVFGIELGIADYIAIVLTSLLASIGAAGVPSAGLIMMSIVMTQVGVPLETIAIIAGVDRVLDMARTATNVAGDATTATVVAKWEGRLDEKVYYAENDI